MSRKISDFFKIEVEKTEIEENSLSPSKIRECRVILTNIKLEIHQNGDNVLENVNSGPKEGNFNKIVTKKSLTIKNKSNRRECEFCDRKYFIGYAFHHMKKFHPEELRNLPFQCRFCDQKFLAKYSLTNHMKKKHFKKFSALELEKFECDFDGKFFKTKSYLLKHLSIHIQKAKCEICQVEVNQNSMKRHVKEVHTEERNFRCEICSKTFKSERSLNTHKEFHDKKSKCDICARIFQTRGLLNQHIKFNHENPNSFECEECGKKFNEKIILKSHQKTHNVNRQRRFKCQRCNYATDSVAHFRGHQKSHERRDKKFAVMENPIKCEKCPTLSKNKRALRTHMRTVHPKVLFQCDLCGNYLKTKNALIKHIKSVHSRK